MSGAWKFDIITTIIKEKTVTRINMENDSK